MIIVSFEITPPLEVDLVIRPFVGPLTTMALVEP